MRRASLLVLPLSLAVYACSHEPVLRPAGQPQVELLGEAYQPADVRAAVVRALQARKFVPEGEEAGRIVARYEKGGQLVRVAVEYSPTQFAIRYMASAGMVETKDPAGNVLVESRYFDWANRLDKAIQEELKRPAKEAAARAKSQRDYEMMLAAQRTAQAQANAQEAQANADAANAPPPQPQVVGIPVPVAVPVAIPAPNVNVQSHTTVQQSSSQSFSCCINGAAYVCPNQHAMNKCIGLDTRECRPNGRCK